MSYGYDHSEDECDRCLEKSKTLHKLPFLYKDMNDKTHFDMGDGYRQYYVCNSCWEMEQRILNAQEKEENIRLEKEKLEMYQRVIKKLNI